MVKNKVYQKMAERGIRTNKELADLTGISQNTIGKIIRNENKRIDYDSLDALCSALDCQPGDLLEYVPEDREATISSND